MDNPINNGSYSLIDTWRGIVPRTNEIEFVTFYANNTFHSWRENNSGEVYSPLSGTYSVSNNIITTITKYFTAKSQLTWVNENEIIQIIDEDNDGQYESNELTMHYIRQ